VGLDLITLVNTVVDVTGAPDEAWENSTSLIPLSSWKFLIINLLLLLHGHGHGICF
jgi:hypothetical protein